MEIYRRGVASDASPSSRPLPLCGIAQEAVCATRFGRASTGCSPVVRRVSGGALL